MSQVTIITSSNSGTPQGVHLEVTTSNRVTVKVTLPHFLGDASVDLEVASDGDTASRKFPGSADSTGWDSTSMN